VPTLELRISGMTCRACETRVGARLRAVPGVTGVRVSASRGRAVVRTEGPVDRARLAAAVEAAGYRVGADDRAWLTRDRAVWRDVLLASAAVAALALVAGATGALDAAAGAGGLVSTGGLLVVVLALVIAWPLGLLIWANGRIQHVAALSGTPDTTPGTTYLLAGSDVRGEAGGLPPDGTEGARTDTVMLLHVPESGPTALISLPRDTYVDIPGYGPNKLNAAYTFGGAGLLVQTVEGLTGIHVDHYAEIGLGGVAQIVDAIGGVELCMDPNVNKVTFPVDDPESGMVWEAPGCRTVGSPEALAFARMRKADHEGDIGRGRRQQQLIQSVASTVVDPSLLWQPTRQVSLIRTGLGALKVSEGTGIVDMGRLALAFRAATGPEGVRGVPPLASLDYRPGNVGSTVLIDEAAAPAFWQQVVEGTFPPGSVVGGIPQG